MLPPVTPATSHSLAEDSDEEVEFSGAPKERKRRRSSYLESSDEDDKTTHEDNEYQTGHRRKRNFPRQKKKEINYDETSSL